MGGQGAKTRGWRGEVGREHEIIVSRIISIINHTGAGGWVQAMEVTWRYYGLVPHMVEVPRYFKELSGFCAFCFSLDLCSRVTFLIPCPCLSPNLYPETPWREINWVHPFLNIQTYKIALRKLHSSVSIEGMLVLNRLTTERQVQCKC